MNPVTFYFSPNTRATGTLILLEEMGVDYQLEVLDINKGELHEPDFLAVNPMGKVPAIVHDGALIAEQAAVFIYLADLYPDTGLAPPIGDPLRGPYLRWMVFYGSCMEPAVMDHFRKIEPGPAQSIPYGSWESVLSAVSAQLEPGPYFFGERFTAADLLWGPALAWFIQFGILPAEPVFSDYVARINARPAVIRAREKNDAIAASQA